MATVKYFFLMFFLFSYTKENFANPMDCEKNNIGVFNSILFTNFDKKGNIIGEDEVIRPIVGEWSNSTYRIQKIFIKNKNKKFKIDSVEITYVTKAKNKSVYKRSYKVVPSKEKGYQEVEGFKFEDGVADKDYRPGVQTYTLKDGEKQVCSMSVDHYYATEEI